jgi:hypothetical protein
MNEKDLIIYVLIIGLNVSAVREIPAKPHVDPPNYNSTGSVLPITATITGQAIV